MSIVINHCSSWRTAIHYTHIPSMSKHISHWPLRMDQCIGLWLSKFSVACNDQPRCKLYYIIKHQHCWWLCWTIIHHHKKNKHDKNKQRNTITYQHSVRNKILLDQNICDNDCASLTTVTTVVMIVFITISLSINQMHKNKQREISWCKMCQVHAHQTIIVGCYCMFIHHHEPF